MLQILKTYAVPICKSASKVCQFSFFTSGKKFKSLDDVYNISIQDTVKLAQMKGAAQPPWLGLLYPFQHGYVYANLDWEWFTTMVSCVWQICQTCGANLSSKEQAKFGWPHIILNYLLTSTLHKDCFTLEERPGLHCWHVGLVENYFLLKDQSPHIHWQEKMDEEY